MGLTGRVAIVTGASQGIGLATARLLAAEGAALIAFLASEQASNSVHPTGVTLPVDAGFTNKK